MSTQQPGVGLVKRVLTNVNSVPYAYSKVQIVDQNSNQTMRLYSDPAGLLLISKVGSTSTDSNGQVLCYVPAGRVCKISALGANGAVLDTFYDVSPGDPTDIIPNSGGGITTLAAATDFTTATLATSNTSIANALSTVTTSITANTTAIATTNANLATNTTAIATNAAAITTTNTNLATTNSNLATTNSNLATTNSNLATTNTNVATNTTAITSNTTALATKQPITKAWRPNSNFAIEGSSPYEQGQPRTIFTGSISGTTLTLSAATSGTMVLNTLLQTSVGSNSIVPGTMATALLTGTQGAAGSTYTVNNSQTLASTTIVSTMSSTIGTTFTTDLNTARGFKVIRRTTRFRLGFSSGETGSVATAFTVAGSVEVPTKNGALRTFIPITFSNATSLSVPAGGGTKFWSDWITWPLSANDLVYVKMYITNGGSSFTLTSPSPLTVAGRNASGISEMAYQNQGSNKTNIAYGSSPWTAGGGYLSGGCWNFIALETDCAEYGRVPTVDIWGDSIGWGAGSSSLPPFLEQVLIQAGIPFKNLCISGSSQDQIPQFADGRMFFARGDIAIVEHGRNSSSTANLASLWSYLRALGYRKIIQTTTTNQTNTGNTALASGGDSSAMRAFQKAQVGVGDGPDVIWDAQKWCQDPSTGLWTITPPADGLHPADAGNTTIANGLISDGVLSTLT